MNVAFIIAAPRSGTTFLEEVFNDHPAVASWHEPYFIWEQFNSRLDSDYLDETHVTERSERFIRAEFSNFLAKSGKSLVLEKTPTNAFKIRFMHRVFPEAKWIHLYRDGRNVVSSAKMRLNRRRRMVEKRHILAFVDDVLYTLKRQPYWRHRLMLVWHELRHFNHLRPYLMPKNDNDASIGWGPRYPGWKKDKQQLSDIQIIANQWVKSEEFIQKGLESIPRENVLHVRYESMISEPEEVLTIIAEFLGVDISPIRSMAKKTKSESQDKWKANLTSKELEEIKPILQQMMQCRGYS
jgi:hypothetical protein